MLKYISWEKPMRAYAQTLTDRVAEVRRPPLISFSWRVTPEVRLLFSAAQLRLARSLYV